MVLGSRDVEGSPRFTGLCMYASLQSNTMKATNDCAGWNAQIHSLYVRKILTLLRMRPSRHSTLNTSLKASTYSQENDRLIEWICNTGYRLITASKPKESKGIRFSHPHAKRLPMPSCRQHQSHQGLTPFRTIIEHQTIISTNASYSRTKE